MAELATIALYTDQHYSWSTIQSHPSAYVATLPWSTLASTPLPPLPGSPPLFLHIMLFLILVNRVYAEHSSGVSQVRFYHYLHASLWVTFSVLKWRLYDNSKLAGIFPISFINRSIAMTSLWRPASNTNVAIIRTVDRWRCSSNEFPRLDSPTLLIATCLHLSACSQYDSWRHRLRPGHCIWKWEVSIGGRHDGRQGAEPGSSGLIEYLQCSNTTNEKDANHVVRHHRYR